MSLPTLFDDYRPADALITGPYRYWLTRTWDPDGPVLCLIMLNPSVADAGTDDPTITRCRRRAMRQEYRGKRFGSIVVVNLYAWRATDPDGLLTWADDGMRRVDRRDAVGPDNDRHITERARAADLVVAAWGAHRFAEARAAEVRRLLAGLPLMCLGTVASGAPRHPLYVKYDTPLTPLPAAPGAGAYDR